MARKSSSNHVLRPTNSYYVLHCASSVQASARYLSVKHFYLWSTKSIEMLTSCIHLNVRSEDGLHASDKLSSVQCHNSVKQSHTSMQSSKISSSKMSREPWILTIILCFLPSIGSLIFRKAKFNLR